MNELPMPWPVTSDTIHTELEAVAKIVERWKARFGDDAFLDQLDRSPALERMQLFAQFTNEMKVVAAKSATLVEVIQ